jgi:protein arginine kinase activator
MVCEECGKRPSILHVTKIINGQKNELHICEVCAREMGELITGVPNSFSIHNLFSGLLDFEQTSANKPHVSAAIRCENCGLTYSQFSKLGRFGCNSCYKSFSDRLEPLLKRVHGSVIHTGKVPKRNGGLLQHKREIELLKKEMMNRIEEEEFEQAAHIRDQIRDIERKIIEN